NETTIIILNGICGLFANYISVFTTHTTFETVWKTLMDYLSLLVDHQSLDVNAAVFTTLTYILSKVEDETKLGRHSIEIVWDVWSRGIPVDTKPFAAARGNNQNCLVAYVKSLKEIYRLKQKE